MTDILKKFPWWGWVLLALVAVLVVLVAIPPLRDLAIKHATGAAAGLFAAIGTLLGMRATRRRSAARDDATAAQDSITERGEVEAKQTEQRRDRAADRAVEAEGDIVRRDVPKTPEERTERLDEITDPFAS